MDRMDAMRVYLRVVELASFSAAADSLGLAKARVSAAVQQLEAQLGTRLLQRTTRKVQPTLDGLACYERCKDLLADLDEMQALFQQTADHLSGRLRVDMPIAIARNLVVPQLPSLLAQHPALELEIGSTDRRVDLIREGFDCVVRVGSVGDPTLIARQLGELRIINCVSPSYIAQHGEPKTLADLQHHQLIHYVPNLGAKSTGWEYHDGKQYLQLPMSGAITVNNSEAYTAACVAGLGIIQTPLVGMQHHLATGALVEVLRDFKAEPMPVYLLYANRRHLPKRVRAFMEWLAVLVRDYCVRSEATG